MKTQILLNLLLTYILLSIGIKVCAQSYEPPTWVFNISGTLSIKGDNESIYQRPRFEEFRLSTEVLKPLSPHVMLGLQKHTQLLSGLQFVHLGIIAKYYPFTMNRRFAPFLEGTPGMAWNRNRAWLNTNCEPFCGSVFYEQKWFFYPIPAIGFSLRFPNSQAAFEWKALYWPQYTVEHPFGDLRGNIGIRASFSFWIKKTSKP